MKKLPPIAFLLFLSVHLFANDTIIIDQSIILSTDFSDYNNVDLIACDSISLNPGFSFSSSINSTLNTEVDPWELDEPVQNLAPGTEVEPSGILDGSFVVGSISGQPGVSPTGAATYNIPIAVPAGTKGMVPQLSVNYSSQRGNGILGRGWDLGGLSSIIATGKVRYYDNESSSISATDTACRVWWDGQRLFALNSAGLDADSFRTEIQSHAKIERSGSGNTMWFTVKTANGQTLEYGNTTDSRMSLDDSTQWNWMLNKVSDRNGNSIKYTYTTDNDKCEILLSKIEYGGLVWDLANELSFHYSTKSDINYAYIHDDLVVNDQILDSISMKSKDSYVGSYGFHFDTSLNETLLDEIVQYDKNNNRFNATRVDWSAPVFNISQTAQTQTIGSGSNYYQFTGDFTGDGIFDLVSVKLDFYNDQCKYYLYQGTSNGLTSTPADSGFIPRSYTHDNWDYFIDYIDMPLGCNYGSTQPPLAGYFGEEDISYIFSGDFDGDGIEELFIKVLEWEEFANYLPADLENGSVDLNGFKSVLCGLTTFFTSPPGGPIILNYGIGHLINLDETIYSPNRKHSFRMGESMLYNRQYSQFPDIDGRGYNSLPDNNSLVYYDPEKDTLIRYCSVTGEQRWGDFNGDGKADFIDPANTTFSINLFDPGNKTYSVDQTVTGYFLGTIDLNNDGISAWVALGDEAFETILIETAWQECQGCEIDNDNDWYDFLDEYNLEPDYSLYCHQHCADTNDIICRYAFLDSDSLTRSVGFELMLNHLSGYGPEICFGIIPGSHSAESPLLTRAVEADINEDERIDLLIFSGSILKTIYYDFKPSYSNGDISYAYSTEVKNSSLDDNIHLGDFNGDGITELIFPDSDKSLCFITSGKPGKFVEAITNGMGVRSVYSYEPMTNTDVYTAETSAEFPVIDFTGPWYLTSSLTTDNGVADSSHVEYSYEGAKIHLQGKGFLGFMETLVENDLFNTSQISNFTYDTTYFHTYPVSFVQKVGASSVKEVNNYTSLVNISGITFSVQTDSVVEHDSLTNITKTTALSYDDNGMISEKKVNMSPQEYVTERYTYTNAGWHIPVLPEYITTTYSRGGSTETDSTFLSYSSNTGNLIQKVEDFGTDRSVTTRITEFGLYGNPTETTISAKRGLSLSVDSIESSMDYDSDGRFLILKTTPLNFSEGFEYDYSTGQLETSISSNGTETHYQYGPFGRLKEKIYPDLMQEASGIFWSNEHSNAPTNALYYKWAMASGSSPMLVFYDVVGRELRSVTSGFAGEDIYVDTEYDSKGRVSQKSRPYFNGETPSWTTYTYDAYGRFSSENYPDTTSTSYDYDGLETTITLRTGSDTITTRTKMNAWGELVESEDNIGNTVFNSYYPDGKLKESYVSEHSTSQKTEFTYDAQGNRTSISDPDAGTITSLYDGFGQLVRQISAKGDTSTYVYDDIGRASISNDQRGNLYYSYIADDTNLAFGNPDSIYNGDKSLLEVYEYDSDYGRLVSEKRTQVGKTFTHTYVYDWFGRPLTRTYPSGFEVRYAYTSNGDLEKVTGGGFTLWSCSDVNALGQITAYSQGANSTSLSYDMHGVLNHVTTGSIVDMQYGFDDLGNLSLREDALTNQKEVFEYDKLSRLTGIEYYLNNIHQSAQDFSTGYDNCGNITSKTGVSSSILYGEDAGPHALTTIETPESTYKPPPQGISYTCFNKVATISDTLTGGIPLTLDFTYGLSNQRIKMVQTRNSTIERVKYFNGDYEEDSTSAGVKKYHYIQGGNGLTAIFVKSGSDNDTMYYVLSDHLGSLTTIVNAETSVVENYSFNAWGMPRDASDWTQSYTGDLFAGRGFTGHEHLMDFNLINMNGRIYDPVLGRFLSPDPYVQAPGYPNNYNRYTYALNNPLRFVDPSGYYNKPSPYEREQAKKGYSYYNPYFSIMNPQLAGNYYTSYTPGFDGNYTNIGTNEGSVWVKNSDILTVDFWSFFNDLSMDINGNDFFLTLKIDYGNLWVVGNYGQTGAKSVFQGLNVLNFESYAEATVIEKAAGQGGVVVDNSWQAIKHYLFGDGSPARIGSNTTNSLLNSPQFLKAHRGIINGQSNQSGKFPVDLTKRVFHIGRTNVSYSIAPEGNSVTYKLYDGDGFWDPDFIDEKYLGPSSPYFRPDGPGPNLERLGGTPYYYIPTIITFPF